MGFSETLHSALLVQKHTPMEEGRRGVAHCLPTVTAAGGRRKKEKKSSSVCLTSERIKVKMSKIIHVPHGLMWCRGKKNIPPKFPHCLSSILSPQLTFSSPFHSRRVLSIIKGTCGTNPCKSPVLSVLYLQATQHTEILHLHA